MHLQIISPVTENFCFAGGTIMSYNNEHTQNNSQNGGMKNNTQNNTHGGVSNNSQNNTQNGGMKNNSQNNDYNKKYSCYNSKHFNTYS